MKKKHKNEIYLGHFFYYYEAIFPFLNASSSSFTKYLCYADPAIKKPYPLHT